MGIAWISARVYLRRRRRTHPYPPGPRPSIIIGNLLDIPRGKSWLVYTDWAKKYHSDILHVSALGQHIVILNSLEAITELLDKRSHIYSDRPYWPITEIMGWSFNTLLMPYGERWREHRRYYQQFFKKEASVKYHDAQMHKIRQMLRNFLTAPDTPEVYYRTIGAEISMSMLYGYELMPPVNNDHMYAITEEAVRKGAESLIPGASIVNTFPTLRHLPRWFPGIGFKEALKIEKLTEDMKASTMKFVKSKMANAAVQQCSRTVSRCRASPPRGCGDVIFGCAPFTTVAAIATFILAMMLYPDVQKKAQRELDKVIGVDCLPTNEDRCSLPYLEAIYRETGRWIPVTNLAAPHATSQDDVYNGFFIPKGSYIRIYNRAVAHNLEVYPEPDAFKPERFFDHNSHLNSDEVNYAFGFGRRICPGRNLASSTVWLTMASILSAFNVKKPSDSTTNSQFNYKLDKIYGNEPVRFVPKNNFFTQLAEMNHRLKPS
ncbi:cytochrome P450 [Crucibulum laeve]|uniref:Cytochrome P450 n=1 Tax=Crucibulum laeve TaxID=68775 RepID=A0A5C3LLR7_9AGAR|nr:cytochrome P450 [Crucibulum laeve]